MAIVPCRNGFSSKEDFLKFAEVEEIIQCSNYAAELEVTKDKQLPMVVLEGLYWANLTTSKLLL